MDNAAPDGWLDVCPSDALVDGGDGVRFEVSGGVSAFAVRFEGRVRAFLNQCAHVPVELDWQPGRFFDDSGRYLICATHGATYQPEDGRCVAGPCRGRSLTILMCEERGARVRVRVSEVPAP